MYFAVSRSAVVVWYAYGYNLEYARDIIRINPDGLRVCQSGHGVDGRILNESDPLVTIRCQVRVWYRYNVYYDCFYGGHVVLQTLVLPEKVVV